MTMRLILHLLLSLLLFSCSRNTLFKAGTMDEAAARELAEAKTPEERFYALGSSAKTSFDAGKFADAEKYARELETMTPAYKGNWNYGNAIQDSNLVLGRLALRDGRTQEAKQYLLAAGDSPGSPQMDSFGPNTSLAKDLLVKGERDVVLEYFERCRKFWGPDHDADLDLWIREVKEGKIPNFGAHLIY